MSMMKQPRPVFIGLVGPSGSGKTTVSEYLRKHYGFERIHAATPLKTAFMALFSCGVHTTERPAVDEPLNILGGVTPRAVLEHLGTRLHEVAPMGLPNLLMNRLNSMLRVGATRVLIDGIRQTSEGVVIQAMGGYVWRLDGELDPEKPCDISQQNVRADFVIPRMDGEDWERTLYGLLDETLAPILEASRVGHRDRR